MPQYSPIATADGKVYEDEFALTLGRPMPDPWDEKDQYKKVEEKPLNEDPLGKDSYLSPSVGLQSEPQDTDPFEIAAARQKGSVRPLEGRTEGKTSKVLSGYLPHVLEGIMTLPERAFKAAEDYRKTGEYDPAPAIETALMMLGARTPFMKQGDLGVFGGTNAYRMAASGEEGLVKAMALDKKISVANTLEKYNWSPQSIYDSTGLYRGREGAWKFEIPDIGMKFKNEFDPSGETLTQLQRIKLETKGGILGDIIDHPELFKAYPWLKDTRIKILKDNEIEKSFGGWAKYKDPHTGYSTIAFRASYLDRPLELKKLLLHETQHLIQGYEGFAKGATYLEAKDLVTKFDADVNEQIALLQSELQLRRDKHPDAMSREDVLKFSLYVKKLQDTLKRFKESAEEVGKINYYRTAGEVEARNVEKRFTNPPREKGVRKQIPDTTEAYHPDDQIVSKRVETYDPFDLDGKAKNMDPDLQVVYRAEPEVISSAAVKVDGKIYEGIIHSDAMEAAAKEFGETVYDKDIPYGFMTNKGRFVSREEAALIAREANQLVSEARMTMRSREKKGKQYDLDSLDLKGNLEKYNKSQGRH
jgi:hypothetical protein